MCFAVIFAIVMLLRDFAPYAIIFVRVCVCVYNRCHGMLLRDFWLYGIIFMNVCVILDRRFAGAFIFGIRLKEPSKNLSRARFKL
jgi:hypothetical protein